jgi:hypothetical protein
MFLRPEQEHKALKITNALEESHLFSQDSGKEQPFSRTARCKNRNINIIKEEASAPPPPHYKWQKYRGRHFRAGQKHSICGVVKEPSRNLSNFQTCPAKSRL